MTAPVSLRPVYGPDGILAPPVRWVVTARDGAIRVECADEATARRYFARWAESEDAQ